MENSNLQNLISSEEKVLKTGFSTGSCATACSVGALLAILGEEIPTVRISLPNNGSLDIELASVKVNSEVATCSVIKDAGDDPDITHGCVVIAKVCKNPSLKAFEVNIFGGKGVGVVTKPGLDQPVGNHAINSVPRKMIEKNCVEVLKKFGENFGIDVEISIPDGEKLAEKTFNPRLGIVGGISVLGTTGIVNPMSDQAIIDTIAVEISQKVAMGKRNILITPGNYGKTFLQGEFKLSDDVSVKCSNFIGDTLEILESKNAESFLLVGHIGKMVKLYQNAFNTHSKFGDGRVESFISACEIANCDRETIAEISNAVSTDSMIDILKRADKFFEVIKILGDQIVKNIKNKTCIPFGLMIFSNVHGLLYKSEKSKLVFDKILEEM